MKKHIKSLLILAVMLTVIFLYYSFIWYGWENREEGLRIFFFSLNRGRSIFINTKNTNILVGSGANTEVIKEITKVVPFYQRKINKIIIPSAKEAEIGGFLEILERYEVEEVIIPKVMATSTLLKELEKEIRKQKIHVIRVEKGDEIEIGDSLKLKVLFPYKNFKFNKTSLPELALLFEYKNNGLFLLGNLSRTIQKDIAKNVEIKTVENLLELYNSGVDSKVSAELLDLIKPKYIFTTKEKSTDWFSDGEVWKKD
jgi:competence protein ComEC